MFDGAGTWFYVHCVLALVLIVTDANGTLEPAVNKFESRLGIYSPPADTSSVEEFDNENY